MTPDEVGDRLREWWAEAPERRGAQLVTLLVVAQLVGGPIAMAATTSILATTGTTLETDSGLAVTITDDRNIESGNPFPASDTVNVSNVSARSTSGGSLDLDTVPADGGSGQRQVSVSNVNAGSDEVILTHPDGTRVGVAGGDSASKLTFNDSAALGDGNRDFNYSAGSTTTVLVDTGGSPAAAVDPGGNVIDDGTVRADGFVAFQLPSGTDQVYLEPSAGVLKLYNETNSSELVTDGTGVRVRFFEQGSDTIIERNATNGTVDLGTLPSDSTFTVSVAANDSEYYYRRATIRNLQEQQQLYVLPKSADSSTVEFDLTDRTGRFSNPTLRVQKPIARDYDGDGSDETRYQTVVGDSFGTSGTLTVELERNNRYRLVLRNSQGESRVLGSFTPKQSVERVPLTVAQIKLAPGEGESGVATDVGLVEQSDGSFVLRTVFEDRNRDTSEVTVTVRNSTNATVVGPRELSNGPYGRAINTFSVNGTPDNESYTVEFEAIRRGETQTYVERAGNISPWNLSYLDGLVSSLLGWVALLALSGLTVIRAPRIGAVASVIIATLFATLGIISIGPVPLGIAGATAVLFVVSRGVGQ